MYQRAIIFFTILISLFCTNFAYSFFEDFSCQNHTEGLTINISPEGLISYVNIQNSKKILCRDGKIENVIETSNDGEPWVEKSYSYGGSRYTVTEYLYKNGKKLTFRKNLYDISGDIKIKLSHWSYKIDVFDNHLEQKDIYFDGTDLVKERFLFDEEGKLYQSARFFYDQDSMRYKREINGLLPSLNRMIIKNKDGEIIQDYLEATVVDLEKLYQKFNYSDAEIKRRIKISNLEDRLILLVMDSGIDIKNPDLAYKLWQNREEERNGIDDNGDGFIDDIFGVSDNPRLHHPVEDIRLPVKGMPGFSHGNLVSSIAVKGREDVALALMHETAIQNSSDVFLRTANFINHHKIKYTNMSFVYDRDLMEMDGSLDRPVDLEEMIIKTPNTLHIIAAGNGNIISGQGYNIDEIRIPGALSPVMLKDVNTLVVGALDTDSLVYKKYPSYKLASFTNFGEVSVDILAPGIETNKRNYTRFLILTHQDNNSNNTENISKASICFSLPNFQGRLSQVLSVLAFYDLDLTKIQSMPIVGKEFQYFFYADITFDSYERYQQSLSAITPLVVDLQILGEYKYSIETLENIHNQ